MAKGKRKISVTPKTVRAARLELQALESAGLRPDPMLRKLANARLIRPEEREPLQLPQTHKENAAIEAQYGESKPVLSGGLSRGSTTRWPGRSEKSSWRLIENTPPVRLRWVAVAGNDPEEGLPEEITLQQGATVELLPIGSSDAVEGLRVTVAGIPANRRLRIETSTGESATLAPDDRDGTSCVGVIPIDPPRRLNSVAVAIFMQV